MLSRFDDPFRAFESLQREMSRFFWEDELPRDLARRPAPSALSIEDTDDGYVLSLPLPGASDDDVSVTVLGDTVELRAQRRVVAPEGHQPRHRERADVSFSRKLRLAFPLDADAATASLENGVLTVTLPKAKSARPQRVAVNAK